MAPFSSMTSSNCKGYDKLFSKPYKFCKWLSLPRSYLIHCLSKVLVEQNSFNLFFNVLTCILWKWHCIKIHMSRYTRAYQWSPKHDEEILGKCSFPTPPTFTNSLNTKYSKSLHLEYWKRTHTKNLILF